MFSHIYRAQSSFGIVKLRIGTNVSCSALDGLYEGLLEEYSGLGLYEGLGEYSGLIGEYSGPVGEYDTLLGEYDGLVGEYDGLVGEYEPQ